MLIIEDGKVFKVVSTKIRQPVVGEWYISLSKQTSELEDHYNDCEARREFMIESELDAEDSDLESYIANLQNSDT